MQIRLANVLLAGPELEGPSQLRVNGQIVVQPADLFRALSRVHYERGNEETALAFTVSRTHATLRLAERFALLHRTSLPKEGELRLTVGTPADQGDIIIEHAVLVSAETGYAGLSTTTTYNLVGGAPGDGGPAPDPEPYDDMIRRGKVSIGNGSRTVSVIFATSLPSAPFPTCNVLMPTTGGSKISATVVEDSITNAGFTAELSGPTPNANYKLSYIAIV